MTRICAILGAHTQAGIAAKLGIRQSSVSDAKRRTSIPDSWLLLLVREYAVNPIWIMRGTGAKFLVPDDAPPQTSQIQHDVEQSLAAAPVAALLRTLAIRMHRPDIQIIEEGAA